MKKIEDLISLLRQLSDSILEIAFEFNSKKIKENNEQQLAEKNLDITDLMIEIDDYLSGSFSRDEILQNKDTLSDEIRSITDSISILMQSYNQSKKSENDKQIYKDIIKGLADLEQKKFEFSKKYNIHLPMIKPSLERGKKLILENEETFINDLVHEIYENKSYGDDFDYKSWGRGRL